MNIKRKKASQQEAQTLFSFFHKKSDENIFLNFCKKGIDKSFLICYNSVNKEADSAYTASLSNILRPNSTDIRRITSVIGVSLK